MAVVARGCLRTSAGPHPLPQREHEQRVARGEDVVGHHAEAVLQRRVELADRRRLHDVEQAEQQEREGDAHVVAADEVQHQQERDDLVPDDGAVIGNARGRVR